MGKVCRNQFLPFPNNCTDIPFHSFIICSSSCWADWLGFTLIPVHSHVKHSHPRVYCTYIHTCRHILYASGRDFVLRLFFWTLGLFRDLSLGVTWSLLSYWRSITFSSLQGMLTISSRPALHPCSPEARGPKYLTDSLTNDLLDESHSLSTWFLSKNFGSSVLSGEFQALCLRNLRFRRNKDNIFRISGREIFVRLKLNLYM